MNKPKHWMVFLLFLALNLLPHIAVAISEKGILLNWYLTDDAFYYFKTAQNIAEGHGITYDGLAPTNGFHPLWMLICIPVFALARIDLYLPLRLLVLIQAVLNAASGYFLYRIISRHTSQAIAWLAAAIWMFLPAIHAITTKLGLESGVNALALMFLIYRISIIPVEKETRERDTLKTVLWAGLAAILALLSRLDNIFLLVMLGMWLVFRKSDMRWHTQVDWLLIFLSGVGGYFLRMQNSENLFNMLSFAYLLLALSMALKPLFLYMFGLYRSDETMTLKGVTIRTILATSLSSLLITLAFFLLHDVTGMIAGYPRMVLLLDWALSLVMLLTVRVLRKLRDQRYGHGSQDTGLASNWRNWFGSAAAYFLPIVSALGVYMAVNLAYAGSAMPVSGQIKRWWGTLPNTVYGQPIRSLSGVLTSLLDVSMNDGPFWLLTRPLYMAAAWLSGLFSLPVGKSGQAHALMLVLVWGIVIAFVLAILQTNGRRFAELADRFALLPIAVGCLMHALSYKASGYLHAKYWYWIAQMLLMLLFSGLLFAVMLERVEKRIKNRTGLMTVAKGLSLVLFAVFSYRILVDFPINGKGQPLYDIEGDRQFIGTHTRPGDVIGMTGGGLIGYFVPDRTIINLDGLINSTEYYDLLKQNRLDEYHRQVGTDFIYGEELILLDSDPYRWTYTNRLRLVERTEYFQLYHYCPDTCP